MAESAFGPITEADQATWNAFAPWASREMWEEIKQDVARETVAGWNADILESMSPERVS